MLPDLTKELEELRRLIQEAESSGDDTLEMAGKRIKLCLLAGEKLDRFRQAIGHGQWLEWFEANVKDISTETARKWIKLHQANKASDGKLLENARSIRHAYQLCGILPEQTDGQTGKPSEGASYLIHADRLRNALSDIDVAKLDAEQRAQLRTRLEPIVALHARL